MRGGPALARAVAWMLRVHAIVAFALASSGCFFLDPVNGAPIARIEQLDPLEVHRFTTVNLTAAESSDPDGDGLKWRWEAMDCTPEPCLAPFATGAAQTFSFQIPSHDPVLVRLTVTDMPGARAIAETTLTPVNRRPTVTLQVRGRKNAQGGFVVGHEVTIVAAGEDADGDPLTYQASCFPPAGAGTSPGCQPLGATSWALVPDALGVWEVEVAANDGFEDGPAVRVPIVVHADLPPCIVATSPPAIAGARYVLGHDDPRRRFGVELVTDELDPYPLPSDDLDPVLAPTRFRWFVRPPGEERVELPGLALPEIWVDPTAWTPGSVVELRVEALDRVPRTFACADDAPICPDPAIDPCAQRVTWEVEIR